MQPKNFVLIGKSGSGKGTQARLLIERFGNLHHISSGDLFRKLASSGSETAKKIAEVIESGGLPFDDIATTLWMYEIAHNVKVGQGFVLDGSPRRLNEAVNFDRFIDFLGQTQETAILLIDISREEAFRRLMQRGNHADRADDTENFINSRLDYYEDRVVPVVEHYEKEGTLVRINGEQLVEKVHQEIVEKLHLE